MTSLPVLKLPAPASHAAIEDQRDLLGIHPCRPEGLGLTKTFVHLEVSGRGALLMPDLLSTPSQKQDKQITHTASLVRLKSPVYPVPNTLFAFQAVSSPVWFLGVSRAFAPIGAVFIP